MTILSAAAPTGAGFDVLIVGYGPAGATAANLLGQRGSCSQAISRSHATSDPACRS